MPPATDPATPPPDPAPDKSSKSVPADQRLDRLEATQAEQGSKLDRILDLISGDEDKAHDAAQGHVESKLDRSSAIKELVTKAVADVGAQQQAEAERAAHAAEHDRLRAPSPDPRPEEPPRVEPTRKQRLQSAFFGGDKS
jgi:hypothetical protein